MRPTSLLTPLAAVVLGALTQASMAPASPVTAAAPPAAAMFRPVALQGMAENPGCAQTAPLFRSMMPSRVAWRPAGQNNATDAPEEELASEDLAAEPEPAMHQALHLCAVERFNPRRPFSGASKAVWHL